MTIPLDHPLVPGLPANTTRERGLLREIAEQSGFLLDPREEFITWEGDFLVCLGRAILIANLPRFTKGTPHA